MSKRKNNFAMVRFVSSVTAIFAVVVMFALIYVWQRNQVVKIGYRITDLERRIVVVDEDTRHIISKVNQLKSPDRILSKITDDLRITSGNRIIHVKRIERKPATSLAQSYGRQDNSHKSWFWSAVSWLVSDQPEFSTDDMLFARNSKVNKED